MPRDWLRCHRCYPILPRGLIGCNMWSSIIASKFGWLPKVKVSSTTFLLRLLKVHYLWPRSVCVATSWTSYYHVYIRVASSAPYYCHIPFVLVQVELLITTFLLGLLQVQLTIATFLFGNEKTGCDMMIYPLQRMVYSATLIYLATLIWNIN
jgi:hypothetical protein